MPIDKGKQQARWRRNKSAERQRQANSNRDRKPHITAGLKKAILDERDRRYRTSEQYAYLIRRASFFKSGSGEKALWFAVDVWAATALIRTAEGEKAASATNVARWLHWHGWNYGYSEQSMRKMVYRAWKRIEIFETTSKVWRGPELIWEPLKF